MKEIREAMPFLFEMHGGTQVPSPRRESESIAEAAVYIKAGSLLFRFAKWRDEVLEATIADFDRPRDVYSLDNVLTVLGAGDVNANGERTFRRYGQLVEGNFALLTAALSEGKIEETRQKLAAMRLQGSR